LGGLLNLANVVLLESVVIRLTNSLATTEEQLGNPDPLLAILNSNRKRNIQTQANTPGHKMIPLADENEKRVRTTTQPLLPSRI
jgi:hypothetical protein